MNSWTFTAAELGLNYAGITVTLTLASPMQSWEAELLETPARLMNARETVSKAERFSILVREEGFSEAIFKAVSTMEVRIEICTVGE